MRAFICVDDDLGRLFGSRRQSRDGTLCADMIKTVGDGLLYIEKYSEPLFSDLAEKVCVCAEPPKDDSYFLSHEKHQKFLNFLKKQILKYTAGSFPNGLFTVGTDFIRPTKSFRRNF